MTSIDFRAADMHAFHIKEAPLELTAPSEDEINTAAAGLCRMKYQRDQKERTRRGPIESQGKTP